ncbi:MAG: hypothetical protein KDD19_30215 [Phaeodactylibacter sp.]|nr:hypothetical protein [Phaeodactylibacter sp.]MCB9052087.1 hypothetical protein [Lewinellaceae bacterium]
MKKFTFIILSSLFLLTACEDTSLDPFKLADITKASIIALRGEAVDNLNDRTYLGSVDRFSKSGDLNAESFSFDADFLSDDLNSLVQVDIYARVSESDPRKPLATVSGSEFKTGSGRYPRASISIPLTTILSTLGVNAADLPTNSYLFIESDLTLTDGTVVPASAIVNSSLFESAIFYPAHNLRYLVTE